MKLYRTCNGCKALTKSITKLGFECSLGYETEVSNTVCDIPISYKPKEQCPKPKTNYGFCKCKRK